METKQPSQPKKKSPAEILRERKIASYQERIDNDKGAIVKMDGERSAIATTNVIGIQVSHKTFGKGIVTKQSDSSITVKFDFGDKRFIMPSAFVDGFLETEDTEINEKFSQYRAFGQQIMTAKEDMNVAIRSIQLLEKK